MAKLRLVVIDDDGGEWDGGEVTGMTELEANALHQDLVEYINSTVPHTGFPNTLNGEPIPHPKNPG